jgi:hypothetical protein
MLPKDAHAGVIHSRRMMLSQMFFRAVFPSVHAMLFLIFCDDLTVSTTTPCTCGPNNVFWGEIGWGWGGAGRDMPGLTFVSVRSLQFIAWIVADGCAMLSGACMQCMYIEGLINNPDVYIARHVGINTVCGKHLPQLLGCGTMQSHGRRFIRCHAALNACT